MSSAFKNKNPFSQLKQVKSEKIEAKCLKEKDQNILMPFKQEVEDEKVISARREMIRDPTRASINLEELQKSSEFCIKIWYKEQRKHIDTLPFSLNELKSIVAEYLISSECIPLNNDEIDLYFHDSANDKWFIETDEDLHAAYRILYFWNPKWLKVVANIRRNCRTKGKTRNRRTKNESYVDRFNEVFNNKEESSSSSDDEEDEYEKLDEMFKLYKPEETKQMIIREGLVYQWERKMGNGTATYNAF